MSFIIDKQTLDDFNLLGKFRQRSIFGLFNKVKTAGGEALLTEMFQNPLTNPEAINDRSQTFRYFQNEKKNFLFNNGQFDALENYLEGNSAGSYPGTLLTLVRKKISATLIRDEEYLKVKTGLQQTVALLNDCKAFIGQLNESVAKTPLADEWLAAKNILNDLRLRAVLSIGGDAGSVFKLAKYDHLLKQILKPALLKVMKFFYQLDVYIAVAGLAETKGFGYATALPKHHYMLSADNLRHPNIDKAVANSVSMHQRSNMIFLTGANMAGKSTFMKAFGINVYLAHMGFPVAAEQMQFSVKDGIYSSINVSDNMDMGYSHFYAEVIRVKKVAEEVNKDKGLVIIFDELFKGTNVKDAYDATLAVTGAFSAFDNCLFIISTHIIEAGEVLHQQRPNIQMLYLPTVMNGNVPTYTYQLQPGISSDRHGMMIIENEGILEMLK